jgi:putative membrane protein
MVEGGQIEWSWWVLPVVALAGLAAGAASWWFTRFRIGGDELRIDSGVLVRRSRRIRLDRIQAVELQQPFLARIVGMAALGIETAGGSGTEATLAYLSLARARSCAGTCWWRRVAKDPVSPTSSRRRASVSWCIRSRLGGSWPRSC